MSDALGMARWRKKGDPNRVTNWLGTLRYQDGDRLRLVRVSGVGTVGVETIAQYKGASLTDSGLGVEAFAQQLLDLAQGHCDEQDTRQEYRLEFIREGTEVPEVAFGLRMEPTDGDPTSYDDEDASPAGQIRQQMAFTRQMMANSMRIPLMALEALARQLDIAHQRITELEKERATTLDLYAEALTMVAEAQAHKEPTPSLTQQVGEVAKVAPGVIGLVRSLMPATTPAATQTGIVKV